MDEIIGKLKHEWNADKAKQSYAQDHERIIKLSAEKMKNARTQHLWNISILSFTLLGISAFFIFVASFQELFSHFGIALMTGGLLVRIIVEISSIYKAKNINMTDSA
ncbi:MAG: hypothetical protein HRT61_16265, partial [Ekhidna sp.]|nr:hypothetical protein [Ekhidna sp.]